MPGWRFLNIPHRFQSGYSIKPGDRKMSEVQPTKKRPKKVRPKSRAQRWADANSAAAVAIEQLLGHMSDLESALEELTSIQDEYTEWKDNLPENLASSALGEKLEEVTNLDISSIADNIRTAIEDAGGVIDEADSVDLPQGFGRD
jgi:hypothetical protein